jgi:hypothetical protein
MFSRPGNAATVAAAVLAASAAPSLAQPTAHAIARATVVDAMEARGVADVAPTRPGAARRRLQVTIRAEAIPGDPSGRRELIVAFD